MNEQKYKPRAGFLALAGIIIMAIGILFYYLEDPTLFPSGVVSHSGAFGFGAAVLTVSLLFSRLEGKIQRLESIKINESKIVFS